jgi:pyruvate dehydrogenase phosphatase
MVAVGRQDTKWSTRAMFDDHNLWNPAENDRLRAQHPDDPDVLVPTVSGIRNWLKGGLLPTRCIGDVSYNRTDDQRDLIDAQLGVRGVWPKSKMISPPYLGWEPDVAVYDATDMRYLILASDGFK